MKLKKLCPKPHCRVPCPWQPCQLPYLWPACQKSRPQCHRREPCPRPHCQKPCPQPHCQKPCRRPHQRKLCTQPQGGKGQQRMLERPWPTAQAIKVSALSQLEPRIASCSKKEMGPSFNHVSMTCSRTIINNMKITSIKRCLILRRQLCTSKGRIATCPKN